MFPADLYDYPDGHVGRKRYVSVRGHVRSIPVFKTYRGADGYNYVHPDYGGSFECSGPASAMVMRDMEPYRSPLDGSMVTSRSHHRDHMRKHNVIEVGNERMPANPNRDRHGPVTGRDIADVIRQLGGQ